MSTRTTPAEPAFATAFAAPGEPQAGGRTAAGAADLPHAEPPTGPGPTSTDTAPGTQPQRRRWRDRIARRPWAVAAVSALVAATAAGGAGYAVGHEAGESAVVIPGTGWLPDGELPADGRPAGPGGGVGPGGGGLPGLEDGEGAATDDAATTSETATTDTATTDTTTADTTTAEA